MTSKIFIAMGLLWFATAQAQEITRRDSLQGGLRQERICYDVQRYDLSITLDPARKFLSGYNDITFRTLSATRRIQVDLFENMQVDSIVIDNRKQTFTRDHGAVFIDLEPLAEGVEKTLRFYYSGFPKVALNAPWDGGFVFTTDKTGNPWIGVAVQGTGASLWYPVKDSQSDEPDRGATIKVAVPDGLMNVSNGRFLGNTSLGNGFTRWDWEVKNPINNYDITLNVGDYVAISDEHRGLQLDYYVLRGNEEIARRHFADVKPMLDCFEEKFGAYPFRDDSFKLVETPYLGMEHQSAIAYGNRFRKGYLGTDMSGTGIALRFDYIIIHEAGHEWFGNSITSKDIADMWIHEGFTTYSETIFIECRYGVDDAMRYINGQKFLISNDKPIIGQYGVNREGSTDMYYKGAAMIHTMRHIIDNDDRWWPMLKKFAETYRHQIITTEDVLAFFNGESDFSFDRIFDQYLRTTKIPELVIRQEGRNIRYRFQDTVPGFSMPVDIVIKGEKVRIQPTSEWQQLPQKKLALTDVRVLTDRFLVNVDQQ